MSGSAQLSVTSPAGHHLIDCVEAAMLTDPNLALFDPNSSVDHYFPEGLYVRRWIGLAGERWVSKTHRLQNPFFVLNGRMLVYTEGRGVVEVRAPHFEITQPGARRVIFVVEDTVCFTVHPNPDDGQDMEKIEERLIESRLLAQSVPLEELIAAALSATEQLTKAKDPDGNPI